MYKITRVNGYSCPDKYLLMKHGQPLIFANGKKRISLCMQYLEGYDVEIGDKKIQRLLDRVKGD